MTGPTAWQQTLSVVNTATQSITTTTETVIATLSNVTSRQAGGPVTLIGSAAFAINASTTGVTLAIRYTSVSGNLLTQQNVCGGIAGDLTVGDGTIGVVDTPSGEYAGQVYVLTIKAFGAAANWNTTFASLQAIL